jgi:ferric-dicitrate binding protein FerR (iron transport regulator)
MTAEIEEIIVKYITKSATVSDLDTLYEWIKYPINKNIFKDYVQTHYAITYSMNEQSSKRAADRLLKTIRKEKSLAFRLRIRSIFKYAAAVLIGILVTCYFFKDNIFNNNALPPSILVNSNSKIETGTDKATLTLENGSVVALEKGSTYQTNNVSSNGEKIVYEAKTKKPNKITYNFLTIPRGGQFQLVLADGTEVWLNSDSQLKYPVSFKEGETREVELVYGEAYFDVSPSTEHKGSKFKVINQFQEVEVVGTEFNIKAYKDESNIYTTLVEGKVIIDNGIAIQELKPKQQLNINLKNNTIALSSVDVYSVISWKKGLFSFKGRPLNEIMRVLSRWYDVDVVFSDPEIQKIKFNGVLSKKQSIEEILTTIKETQFIKDYDITDKKITIR